ncbi:MAG: ATP-binding cassette domain-containing protein [Halomonadaceae bacterium]|nr:MAG: ATP-binding cassette domain-containing protein [Halomonadaceae bacterium]
MGRGANSVTPGRGQQPLVTFAAVRAGYRQAVVGPVSFQVMPGEILGLSGANGAGKSTLLNALTGVARVFSGKIHRSPGLSVSHHRQRPVLPPELPLTGGELLRLMNAHHQDQPERLQPLLDKPLAKFSGGQFQFLQACACIGSQSDLIILDEPTNNLDGHAIHSLSGLLAALAPHRGVLLVSHEQAFLQDHCSRVIDIPLSDWSYQTP